MIKFRFHRGNLIRSMETYREYADIGKMLIDIAKDSNGLFKASDVVISESYGEDERIGWNSWRYVCTTRIGNEKYDTPQCIGMCDLGETH